eukprot:gene14817-16474_t
MSFQIFISLRFAEAIQHAEIIKKELEIKGISTFLCAVEPGGDIAREIVSALTNCKLVIIMGSKTYGKDTGAGFSTFEELRFICSEKIPYFLVKMCDRFEEPETRFRLDNSISYLQWFPNTPMPNDLITRVIDKLSSVSSLPSPAPSPAIPSAPVVPKKTFPNGDIYEGELIDDKPSGHGKMIYANKDVYEGEFVDGMRSGKGKCVYFENHRIYEGEWKNDKRHGKGKVTFPGKYRFYEGDFQDDQLHGKGKYTYSEVEYYDGDWEASKRHGFGKNVQKSGTVYEGQWINDKQEGKGREISAYDDVYEGNIYEGDWQDNDYCGQGRFIIKENGAVYEGSWKAGASGEGRVTFVNGDIYEGQWNSAAVHGVGTMAYANGDVYRGHWESGQRHGQGTMQYASQKSCTGEFKYDSLSTGKGTFIFSNGVIFEGELNNDNIVGKMRSQMPNGTILESNSADMDEISLRNPATSLVNFTGKARVTYPNGSVYEGDIRIGRKDGKGRLTDRDGKVLSGKFENNEHVSSCVVM